MRQTSHNHLATELCAHLCYKMVHCGIWGGWIVICAVGILLHISSSNYRHNFGSQRLLNLNIGTIGQIVTRLVTEKYVSVASKLGRYVCLERNATIYWAILIKLYTHTHTLLGSLRRCSFKTGIIWQIDTNLGRVESASGVLCLLICPDYNYSTSKLILNKLCTHIRIWRDTQRIPLFHDLTINNG